MDVSPLEVLAAELCLIVAFAGPLFITARRFRNGVPEGKKQFLWMIGLFVVLTGWNLLNLYNGP